MEIIKTFLTGVGVILGILATMAVLFAFPVQSGVTAFLGMIYCVGALFRGQTG